MKRADIVYRMKRIEYFILVPNLLGYRMFLFQVYRAVNYYYMVESRTVWPNLWRVINLIHILLILAHWFGCFYFLLSEAEGFQVRNSKPNHIPYSIIFNELTNRDLQTKQCACYSPSETILVLCLVSGRLGVSLSPRRLCHANSQVPGIPLLVHIDVDHHRGFTYSRNKRWVSTHHKHM